MGAALKFKSFDVVTESDYLKLSLVGDLENDACREFTEKMSEIYPSPMHVALDCEKLKSLSSNWVRALVQFQQKVKADEKEFRLFSVPDATARFIRQEGLEDSLKMAPNLKAALVEMGLATPAKVLDVNFINPFLVATLKVLETQAQTKATAGKVYRRDAKDKYLGDISGVIGLVTDAFSGSVVISFPAATFLKIMSRMIGEECTVINKDIEDGAGEITNIIFGQAKITLNEKGFGIKTALPSVISGHDHSVLQMTKGPRMVIPFESDVGPFFVEVCVS